MSITPVEQAAIPTAIVLVEAMQTFVTNLGTDPLQVAIKFPGAAQVFLGTAEMQIPVLASAEFGAAQAAVNTKLAGWLASLKAAQTA